MSDDALRPIVTYPRDAVLDKEHVAAMLGIGVRTLEASGIPYHRLGTFRKYICGEVLDHLAAKPQEAA